MTNLKILLALVALAASMPAKAATLFDSITTRSNKVSAYGQVWENGYTRSRVVTDSTGLPTGVGTNGAAPAITNHIFEIPFSSAGSVPVSYRLDFANASVASNTTVFLQLSLTGTNEADFITKTPILIRWPGTNSGSTLSNIPASVIGGARFIRSAIASNDAYGGYAYFSNAVFGARFGPVKDPIRD